MNYEEIDPPLRFCFPIPVSGAVDPGSGRGVLLVRRGSASPGKPIDPAHFGGWAVIPAEQYRVLRAKAYPVEHAPEPAPLDATLTRVDYDLHVLGDLAAGRANLTIDVLQDGWVRVPVPTGLLVRAARPDGRLVSRVPGAPGKGTHLSALLSHSGRRVLKLDVDVPVRYVSGGRKPLATSDRLGSDPSRSAAAAP